MLVGSQSHVSRRKARSVSVWARERKKSHFLEPLSQRIYDATREEGANIIGIVTGSFHDAKNSDQTGRLQDAKAALSKHLDKVPCFSKDWILAGSLASMAEMAGNSPKKRVIPKFNSDNIRQVP